MNPFITTQVEIYKYGIIILLFLGILFIGVIINQINAMNKIISLPVSKGILLAIAYFLLIFAISLFALAIVIL